MLGQIIEQRDIKRAFDEPIFGTSWQLCCHEVHLLCLKDNVPSRFKDGKSLFLPLLGHDLIKNNSAHY
jgi:hypothetical protein